MAKTTTKAALTISKNSGEPGDITPHTEVMTLPQRIKQELSRFDFPKQEIVKLKKKYSTLSISGMDDKKGYEAVDTARKDLKKKRAAVENKREEVKADYLAMGRGIDEYAKELKTMLTDGDGGVADLEAKIKVIDDKVTAEKERKEQEEADKLKNRVDNLEAAGLKFDGRFYSLEDITMDIVTIKSLPDEAYELLVSNVTKKKAELDKIEADRLKKEQADREAIEKQRVENEQKEKQLQEREEAIKRQEQQAIDLRNQNRARFLHGLGLSFDASDKIFHYNTPSGMINLTEKEVYADDEQQWQTRSEGIQKSIKDINAQEETRLKELAEQKEKASQLLSRNAVRFAKVEGLGLIFLEASDQFIFKGKTGDKHFTYQAANIREANEKDFPAMLDNLKTLLSEFKESEEKIAEENRLNAEKKRKESLSEADTILEFIAQFSKVPAAPIMKTNEGQKIINDFDSGLAELIIRVNEAVTELTK